MDQHDERLREAIERLRAEIGTIDPADTRSRERLRDLANELERQLASPVDEGDEDLGERVRDAVERFEAEHPRVTEALNQISVILGNMGL